MEINNKHKVGESVWFLYAGKAQRAEIIAIKARITREEWYRMCDPNPKYSNVIAISYEVNNGYVFKEEEVFPTKESMLKSL